MKLTTHQCNKVNWVTIMITRWERDLIMRFGYPFEDIERQLLESGDADLARVTDAPYWWEQLIINLRISVNEKTEIHRDEVLEEAVEQLIVKVAIALGLI